MSTHNKTPFPVHWEQMIKFFLFLLGLLPVIKLAVNFWRDQLGADPLNVIINDTGIWSLNFLLLTLAVTPFRLLTGWNDLNKRLQLRRLWGLYAFFYGSLHLLAYLWFEQGFNWSDILDDLFTRPAMAIGLLSFLLMLPLAITSHSSMIKQLGKHHWKQLHYLIYWLTFGSLIHFWLLAQAKADLTKPLTYVILLTLLLLLRFPPVLNRLTKKPNH